MRSVSSLKYLKNPSNTRNRCFCKNSVENKSQVLEVDEDVLGLPCDVPETLKSSWIGKHIPAKVATCA